MVGRDWNGLADCALFVGGLGGEERTRCADLQLYYAMLYYTIPYYTALLYNILYHHLPPPPYTLLYHLP